MKTDQRKTLRIRQNLLAMKSTVGLRNMGFALAAVSDVKHVALVPEVQHALIQWIKNTVANSSETVPGVLIGGLAMSFYSKPRYTEDVDLLFLSESEIPEVVPGFKRTRSGAFQDNKTHVEVETVIPSTINCAPELARKLVATAKDHQGLRVISLEGFIALKLSAADNKRRELKDLGDICAVLENNSKPNMSHWNLSKVHQLKFDDCCNRVYGAD